jgi:carbon monoxide dehydrogenase subunit G
MRFEGVFDVGASKERVFATMTDPKQVSQCMPDVRKLEVKSPEEFDAVINVGVSFIRGDFAVHFKWVEKTPSEQVNLAAHGTGLGSAVDLEIIAKMSARSGGGTAMSWTVDAKVSGKLASLGQRMIESQAEKIIKQLFECLRLRLESA